MKCLSRKGNMPGGPEEPQNCRRPCVLVCRSLSRPPLPDRPWRGEAAPSQAKCRGHYLSLSPWFPLENPWDAFWDGRSDVCPGASEYGQWSLDSIKMAWPLRLLHRELSTATGTWCVRSVGMNSKGALPHWYYLELKRWEKFPIPRPSNSSQVAWALAQLSFGESLGTMDFSRLGFLNCSSVLKKRYLYYGYVC